MSRVEFQDLGMHGAVNVKPMSVGHLGKVPTEDDVLYFVGDVAGECYNSKRDFESCRRRALGCIKNGHHSPWEHTMLTLKCHVDRGTSHALVRHRHCAFQQSSTIYTKVDGRLDIIGLPAEDPCDYRDVQPISDIEFRSYNEALRVYTSMVAAGAPAGRARDVLPNATAANLIITTGVREWMYILHRRNGGGDAVRMHCFDALLREWFEQMYPLVTRTFDEWYLSHPL